MISLLPSEERQRKKILWSLKKEIKFLNFKIEHKEFETIKTQIKKKALIAFNKGRLWAPFMISLGISIGVFSAFGSTPIYLDDEECFRKDMEEIDKDGNIRIEQQYDNFVDNYNSILLYGSWISCHDGIYERSIEIYNVSNISNNEILNYIKQDNINIKDVLGEPIETKKEKKNNLSDIEKEEKPYLLAHIFSEDKNDFIYVKQSVEKNIGETILWFFILMTMESITIAYRDISPFNYSKTIDEIKRKYSKNYIEDLIKKRDIYLSNYNRLVGCSSGLILDYQFSNEENVIFNYLNPHENTSISKLQGLELQKLLVLINELSLEYRDILNLDNSDTFGIELEMEYAKKQAIISKFKSMYQEINALDNCLIFANFYDHNRAIWTIKYDGSLTRGIEVTTPPMKDQQQNWNFLRNISDVLLSLSIIGKNSSAHIHFGSHIFGSNTQYWLNFLKIWSTYENVIFRFLYGEYLTARPCVDEYASPVAKDLMQIYEDLKSINDLTFKQIIYNLSLGKYRALNFQHVNVENDKGFMEDDTVEVRVSNNTDNVAVLQNYVNLIMKLCYYCKSSSFDDATIDKRYALIKGKYDSIIWYDEIYLEQALELCDLVFDNNFDKCYFLKQYIKSFKVNTGIYKKGDSFSKKYILKN